MRDLQESHYAGLLGLIRLTPKIIMYLPILLISYYANIVYRVCQDERHLNLCTTVYCIFEYYRFQLFFMLYRVGTFKVTHYWDLGNDNSYKVC